MGTREHGPPPPPPPWETLKDATAPGGSQKIPSLSLNVW